MKDLNVNKEIDLLKQTNPIAATAFEKVIKSFQGSITNIEGNLGPRITLACTKAEQAHNSAKKVENEFSKLKKYTDSSNEVEKLLKHLRGRINEFRSLENKTNQLNQTLIDMDVQIKEFSDKIKAIEVNNKVLASLSDATHQALATMAIQIISTFPEDYATIIFANAKVRREKYAKDLDRHYRNYLTKIRKNIDELDVNLTNRGGPIG